MNKLGHLLFEKPLLARFLVFLLSALPLGHVFAVLMVGLITLRQGAMRGSSILAAAILGDRKSVV